MVTNNDNVRNVGSYFITEKENYDKGKDKTGYGCLLPGEKG